MYQIELLKSKIHGAKITDANLHYKGSLTLDEELMDAAGMVEYEKILVVNNSNAERLETYFIKGPRGSGVCCLNGAAARKAVNGDVIIIMSFLSINHEAAGSWKPTKVFVDQNNEVEKIEIDK